jgi:hypothetical protein
VWDLSLFGHRGKLDFTGISQHWVRETTKRWAAEDLPKRRSTPAGSPAAGWRCAITPAAWADCRSPCGCGPAGARTPPRWAAPTWRRSCSGWLTCTRRTDQRRRAGAHLPGSHARAHPGPADGTDPPGGPAGEDGEGFAIRLGDIPAKTAPGERGKDLPAEILRQLCQQLHLLPSPEIRAAIEVAIDTGRRPKKSPPWPRTSSRDADGGPSSSRTTTKPGATSGGFRSGGHRQRDPRPAAGPRPPPGRPVAGLKLLPADRRSPCGAKALTAFTLGFAHRDWVTRLPALTTSDGTEFDKRRVILYAYRHSYAQRHADSGLPVNVLREPMDHRKLDTNRGYYSVGETRRPRRSAASRRCSSTGTATGSRAPPGPCSTPSRRAVASAK